MGTDIHAAIEYRDAEGWHAYLFANKYHGKYDDEPLLTAHLNIDRDYDLFAILGNIRNGVGFAGCKLGDGFEPISDRRGVPDDVTPESRAALSNDHSPTWVSLLEILEYDWTRSTNKYGVVNAKEFAEWERMKEWCPAPPSFSGDVMGPNVRKITERQMRDYVSGKLDATVGHDARVAVIESLDQNLYAPITWNETYAKAGDQIWTAILPIMLRLAKEHGQGNVRMVMDFDS